MRVKQKILDFSRHTYLEISETFSIKMRQEKWCQNQILVFKSKVLGLIIYFVYYLG